MSKRLCIAPSCQERGNLQCPKCVKLNIDGSFFCSQECFTKQWSAHKIIHKSAKPAKADESSSSDGDIATNQNVRPGHRRHRLTEKSRPGPKSSRRTIPDTIDYAESIKGDKELQGTSTSSTKVMADEEMEGVRVSGQLEREVLDAARKVIGVGVPTDEIHRTVHEVFMGRLLSFSEVEDKLSKNFDDRHCYFIQSKGPSELLLTRSTSFPSTSSLSEDLENEDEVHAKDLRIVATKLHISTDILRQRIFRNYQRSKKQCKVKMMASSPSLSVQRQNQLPKGINCAKVFAAAKRSYVRVLKLQTNYTSHDVDIDVNGQNSLAFGSPDLSSQFWGLILKINGNGSISVSFNEQITCVQKFKIVIVRAPEQSMMADKRLSNVFNSDIVTNSNSNVWPVHRFTEKLRPAPQTSRRLVFDTKGKLDHAENIEGTPLSEKLRETSIKNVLADNEIEGVIPSSTENQDIDIDIDSDEDILNIHVENDEFDF